MIVKLWDQLSKVTQLEFTANCRNLPPTHETRKGAGSVTVQCIDDDTLTFFEKGSWTAPGMPSTAFTNVFRWKIDRENQQLSLEHLRFGAEQPVLLLTLLPVDKGLLKSLKPHECKEDTYFGSVLFDDHFIHLNWRIVGPGKNSLKTGVYT